MSTKPWVAYDTETKTKGGQFMKHDKDGLIWGRQEIVAFTLCHKGEAYSFLTSAFDPKYPTMEQWGRLLRGLISTQTIIVMHNANYDCMVTWFVLNMFPRRIWDTMIGGWIADVNKMNALKDRAILYGRYLQQTRGIDFSNLNELADYVETDGIATDEMFQMQWYGKVVRPKMIRYMPFGNTRIVNPMPELELKIPSETLDLFGRRFIQLQELPVLRATMRAQLNGVYYDAHYNDVISKRAKQDMDKLEKSIYGTAKKTFNLNSPKQLAEVLEGLGVTIPMKTKTGAPSVSAESLYYMKGQHQIIEDIMDYRAVSKLDSTYLGNSGLKYFINPETRRIHPTLNTIGARTGRFSSSKPNLQQIPSKKDKYGIKYGFRTQSKKRKMICLDYSQMEIRMMCIFARDPLMTEVLNDPKGDIHTVTAERFNVERDPVAKFCNFNLQYGGGGYMLAKILTLAGVPTTPDEGENFKRQYDNTYHRVPAFRDEMYAYHLQEGWFPMLTGRRLVIEGLDSTDKRVRHKAETQAINNLIQGSSQDWLKAAIVRIDPYCINPDRTVGNYIEFSDEHRRIIGEYAERLDDYRELFKRADLKWLLQVHDEMLFEANAKLAKKCADAIAEIMTWRPYFEPVVDLTVPIRVDGGVADTWGDAKGKTPDYSIAA